MIRLKLFKRRIKFVARSRDKERRGKAMNMTLYWCAIQFFLVIIIILHHTPEVGTTGV